MPSAPALSTAQRAGNRGNENLPEAGNLPRVEIWASIDIVFASISSVCVNADHNAAT
jgi:hypothetical protein